LSFPTTITGYNFLHSDSEKKSSGVGIYTDSNISYQIKTDIPNVLRYKEVESNFNDAILKVMKSENRDIIDIETRWQKLKESILHGAKKVIGVKEKKREKKPWITE